MTQRSLDRNTYKMLVALAVIGALGLGSAAHAVTQNSTWTGLGTGQNWSDPNNWSSVLSKPPINELIAGLEFNVIIPISTCAGTVDFDNSAPITNPAYILNLTLESGCQLDIEAGTHLIVCGDSSSPFCDGGPGTFTQAGILNAIGGNFTADFHSMPGNSQQIWA